MVRWMLRPLGAPSGECLTLTEGRAEGARRGNPIFFENSDYTAEFLGYLASRPEEAERIPDGAVVVFLPDGDLSLAAYNTLAVQCAEAYRDKAPLFVTVRATWEPG